MSPKPLLAIALFCIFLGYRSGNHGLTVDSFKVIAHRWIQAPAATWARLHRPGFEPLPVESPDVLDPHARELVEKMQSLGWQDYMFTRAAQEVPGNSLLQRVTEAFWPVRPVAESPRKVALAKEVKTPELAKCRVELAGKGGALVDCSSP